MSVSTIGPASAIADGPSRAAEASEGPGREKLNERDANAGNAPPRRVAPTRSTSRLIDIKV